MYEKSGQCVVGARRLLQAVGSIGFVFREVNKTALKSFYSFLLSTYFFSAGRRFMLRIKRCR
jgi:hypothetical protein